MSWPSGRRTESVLCCVTGYNAVIRIPKGATNIDIQQGNPNSPLLLNSLQDDNYLGKSQYSLSLMRDSQLPGQDSLFSYSKLYLCKIQCSDILFATTLVRLNALLYLIHNYLGKTQYPLT